MKILKYIGIAIGALIVFSIGLGLSMSSFEYASTVSVNASVQKCWTVLQDTSRRKKWTPGLEHLTLKSGDHMKPGATYEIIIHQDELYVMQEVVKELRDPEKASFELTNDVMKAEYTFNLLDKGSTTQITCRYRIIGNNVMWKAILYLFKGYLQREAQGQLNLLKNEIERAE